MIIIFIIEYYTLFVIALIIFSDYRRIKYISRSCSKFEGKKIHTSLWFRWGSIFLQFTDVILFKRENNFFSTVSIGVYWLITIVFSFVIVHISFFFLFIISVFLFISIHIFHTPYSKNVGKTRSRIRVKNAMIWILKWYR